MSTIYPSSIDDSTTLPQAVDLKTPVKAEVVNNLRGAIVAIENELGIDPSGTYGTVRARLDAIESGGGGGGGSPVDVQQNGVTIVSNVTKLNFTGGVTVTNPSGTTADIAISGGGGSSDGYAPVYEQLSLTTNGQTIFSLSHTPVENDLVLLFISGIKQVYGTDYTVSGTTLTYNNNPSLVAATDVLDVIYFISYTISSGGGGGSQTLSQTLGYGNVTGGYDVVITNGDNITIGGSNIKQDSTNSDTIQIDGGTASTYINKNYFAHDSLSWAIRNTNNLLIESGVDADGYSSGNYSTLTLRSGSGVATDNGAPLTIEAGDAINGNAGYLYLNGGSSTGANGGGITATAGDGNLGGTIILNAGSSSGSVTGGDIVLNAGNSSLLTGGSITINAGDGYSSNNGGDININSGSGGSGGDINLTSIGSTIINSMGGLSDSGGGYYDFSKNFTSVLTSGNEIHQIRNGSLTLYTSAINPDGYSAGGSVNILCGSGGFGGSRPSEIQLQDDITSGDILIKSMDGYYNKGSIILTSYDSFILNNGGGYLTLGGGAGSGTTTIQAASPLVDGYGGNISINAGDSHGASYYGGYVKIKPGTSGSSAVGANLSLLFGGGTKEGNIFIGNDNYVPPISLDSNGSNVVVTSSNGIVYISSRSAISNLSTKNVYIQTGLINNAAYDGISTGNIYLNTGNMVNSSGGGATGNVTISSGDNLIGNSQATGSLTLKTGTNSTVSAGASGNVTLQSGDVDTSTSGTLSIKTGDQTNVSTGGTTGALTVSTGRMYGGGPSGNLTISTGQTTVAPSGEIIISPGASSSGAGGSIQLRPGAGGATNGSIKLYSSNGSVVWVWPQVDGSSGQVLRTNGSGTLSWTTATGGSSETIIDGYFTSDQNNYSPTGWPTATHIRLSDDASRTITGFASVSAPSTRYVINVGNYNITLSNNNSSSSAANRITTPGGIDFTLEPNDVATLWYDQTSSIWRIL